MMLGVLLDLLNSAFLLNLALLGASRHATLQPGSPRPRP